MGTVVAHYPISLFDHDQKKLEMNFDEQKMWKDFEEKYLKDYKYPSDRDEYRPPYTNNYYGGVDFPDAKTTGLIRGIGWDLIKSIGKKIISISKLPSWIWQLIAGIILIIIGLFREIV